MLRIENLHATVAGKPILNGLTLTVPTGEIHAIMGPNGAGKSTLAYVLGGRPGYEVTEGSARFLSTRHPGLEPGSRFSSATEAMKRSFSSSERLSFFMIFFVALTESSCPLVRMRDSVEGAKSR